MTACRSITDLESAKETRRPRHAFDLREENQALRAELDQLQPLLGAAILTATAFRLRDGPGLTSALRLLARAVREVERRQILI